MAPYRRILILVVALVAAILPLTAASAAPTPVFINEIHYDNDGTDTGEAIEIAGPAGTDLTGWTLVLYNGNGGVTYNTIGLGITLGDNGAGFGTHVFLFGTNGVQNGAPDGMALVDDTATVVQFLSYEGSFVATDGPANGMSSTDIGVSESSTTPAGYSLQLGGTGSTYEDFTWQTEMANTYGLTNTNQTFTGGGGGTTTTTTTTTTTPPPTEDAPLVINEVDYDQPGSDNAEFVEIKNVSDAPVNLDAYSLDLVNGNGGSVYASVDLPDVDLAAGDYYVVCATGAAVSGCDLEGFSSIQNGAPDAVAIMLGSDIVDTLSYEGDVAGYTEGSGATGDPGFGSAANESISRVPDGSDTNDNSVDFANTCATPGATNAANNVTCSDLVFIHDIQGTGGDSPLDGERVTIEGVVVADEETFDSLAGFFVQEEDSDVDGDAMTSEGIFVFNFSNDSVDIGDVVRVEGTVDERFGNTQLTDFVEIVEVDANGSRTASPSMITYPLVSLDDMEAVEGMLVTFTQDLVISEYFNYDRFGEIVVGLPSPGFTRQMQPNAVYEPGSPDAMALREFNLLSRITIDDGKTSQNPDFMVHPIFRDEFTLQNSFRGGDSIGGLQGAIYYTFGRHVLYPNGHDTYTPNPRPGVPNVGGDIKVATLNVLNYFLTIDDRSNNCGPNQDQNCRGADTQEEFDRQRQKMLEALLDLDADVIGLIEMENTPGVEPMADIVAGMNAALGADIYDYVDAGIAGPDVIKVGLIYNKWTVTQTDETAVLDSPDFIDPRGSGVARNRAAVAATFKEQHGNGRFSVVVNHFKSKGSACGAGDDEGPGDFFGSCNLTRTLAAEKLVEWIGTNPTGAEDTDWLIIGDLNSYGMEDPIDVLVGAGYANLVADTYGPAGYSYVFDGELGNLDYILASEGLSSQVTGAAVWHLNADEPDIIDYDMSFKSDTQDLLFDGTNPYRSSDHDAVIVGLDLSRSGKSKGDPKGPPLGML